MGVSLLMTVSPIDTSEIPVIITMSPEIVRRVQREIKFNMTTVIECGRVQYFVSVHELAVPAEAVSTFSRPTLLNTYSSAILAFLIGSPGLP